MHLKKGYRNLHNIEARTVLAPHGCGETISIIPDFMSCNARQLGERGGLGAPQPELPQSVIGSRRL